MALRASEVHPGDVLEMVVVDNLSRTQIVQYAGASGDFTPLHTDEIFATQVAGYPAVFAMGMLTMGMTGRMLTHYVGDGRLRSFGGRFTGLVWPGDTLTSRAVVERTRQAGGEHVVELSVVTRNQDGADVFAGYASALVDPPAAGRPRARRTR